MSNTSKSLGVAAALVTPLAALSAATPAAAQPHPGVQQLQVSPAIRQFQIDPRLLQVQPGQFVNPGVAAGGAFVEESGPSWVEWRGENRGGFDIRDRVINPQIHQQLGGQILRPGQAVGSNAFVESPGPSWVEWRGENRGGFDIRDQVINPQIQQQQLQQFRPNVGGAFQQHAPAPVR